MVDTEVAIIGAGAVGLACAAHIARDGRSVVVLERHERMGQEVSSRNSGVIHAGLYYSPGSLKAAACVEGRELLYARCVREGIAHRKTGKIVVAQNDAEIAVLESLRARGIANGAGALEMLSQRDLARLEPRVRAIAGLLSPESGIVDPHELASSYAKEARAHGASIAFRTEVQGLDREGDAWSIATRSESGEFSIRARSVINAAGLACDRVAALAGLDVDALGWRLRLCKGDYFAIAARHRGIASHLIYPVPVHAGLGVHLTMDLAGGLRAGPDTEYVDLPRYDVDPKKAGLFAAAMRTYLPEIEEADLAPDYAGIRPKLYGPNEPPRDFVIEEKPEGLVHLIGIESPGLTASEALARRAALLIRNRN